MLGLLPKTRAVAAGILALSLGGCAISPGPEVVKGDLCNFDRYALSVEIKGDPKDDQDDGLEISTVGSERTFASEIRDSYSEDRGGPVILGRESEEQEPVSLSMLLLSGGSQNGAFGAGFLDGWARKRGAERLRGGKGDGSPDLPRFSIVTGISAGAILSTFAFIDRPDIAAREFAIERENQVLRPYVRSKKIGLGNVGTIAKKGAFGELDPLRQRLRQVIDNDMMALIAREHRAKRKLYIGAVDVDTGQAVAFDMTAMASRIDALPREDEAQRKRLRNCYVEVIVASSSVPLAAPATFIDNRMYIDGGARFGVFGDEIGAAVRSLSAGLEAKYKTADASERSRFQKPNVFILINGTLTMQPRCGKLACPEGSDPLLGKHKDWDLLDLAGQSVSILINQTYRFSTDRIITSAGPRDFKASIERMEPDYLKFQHEQNGVSRKCGEWSDKDVELSRPIEFHPRYMNCVIAYGATRAVASEWWSYE
jgi:predicted patatin/cPLA2 family phospholipase